MMKSVAFALIVMPLMLAVLAACAPDQASAPYSQMVSPNYQFGAAGGGGGGGGGAGGGM